MGVPLALDHVDKVRVQSVLRQPMSAPNLSLAPIRPASEQQAALRKRAATVPNKNTRLQGTSGPKVVACNFCRGELLVAGGVLALLTCPFR